MAEIPEEYVKNRIFVIDKPCGPTSHQVASWVKNMLKVKIAGHGGTLDPGVSGVLVIGTDKAAQALHYLLYDTKEYIVAAKFHSNVTREDLEPVLTNFRGDIYQLPPIRAAVKRALRIRRIHKLEILDISDRFVLFDVVSDAGTYIRTLVRDIGDATGIGAHMEELRRIRTGPFTEKESVNLYTLKDSIQFCTEGDCSMLSKISRSLDSVFTTFPSVVVREKAESAIAYGANLYRGGIYSSDPFNPGDIVSIHNKSGVVIAAGKALKVENNKPVVDIEIVFVDSKKYKKIWKTGQ